ncbi:hypothetical protein BJ742DRAFT_681505 [Cladochytrium replicatum]|nr:hypothetical protein BJ742DRAFT_681505 [Cladochytrium replicatum]
MQQQQQKVPYNPAAAAAGVNQQGSAPNPPPYGNFINEFQSNPAAQLGMQFGSSALKQGQEYVNQNINRYINVTQLRYYFNVSNSYVFNKIRLLLFPYRQRQWLRLVKRSDQTGQMEGYNPPREDINAPDLYIPVMGYVTYILLVGMVLGAEKKFKPDELGMTSTTSAFIILVEIIFLKFGCYLLNVPTEVPLLDLVAYTGYKFVGVIITLLTKLILIRLDLKSSWIVWAVFLYTMLSFGLFTLRSLRYLLIPDATHRRDSLPDSGPGGVGGVQVGETPMRRRRVQFLFLVAAIQAFFAWLMV